jgi:uncharacterized protein with PIN domain
MAKKRSHSEFLDLVEQEADGHEYEVKELYVKKNIKILFFHKRCGHYFPISPVKFLNAGHRCHYCNGGIKKTHEQFIQEVLDQPDGHEYEVKELYKDHNTKILFLHRVCGREFPMSPSKFLNAGHRCHYCNPGILKTHENFVEQFNERKDAKEFKIIGKYKGMKKEIKIEHIKCGHIFYPTADHLIHAKVGCPLCNGGSKRTTNEFEYKLNLTREKDDKFKIITDYMDATTKIQVRHEACGNEFWAIPTCLLNGETICRFCYPVKPPPNKKNQESFLQEVFESPLGHEYEVNGEYQNAKTPISIEHKLCGFVFDITPDDFINKGMRCPKCCGRGKSVGVQLILDILKKQNIHYKTEYTFPDCRNINVLRFDIAIFDHNLKFKGLIEYDGKQHFMPITIFGGVKRFLITLRNDLIKNEYCKKNDLPLLRVTCFDSIKVIDQRVNLFLNKVLYLN